MPPLFLGDGMCLTPALSVAILSLIVADDNMHLGAVRGVRRPAAGRSRSAKASSIIMRTMSVSL